MVLKEQAIKNMVLHPRLAKKRTVVEKIKRQQGKHKALNGGYQKVKKLKDCPLKMKI